MDKTIFDFQDYKTYLEAVIADRSHGKRGFRTELAEGAGVQLAHLYQVLKRGADFNLEHADRLNRFLDHNPDERHYFLLLIQYARAGSESLREYFRDQMSAVHSRRMILKKRLKKSERTLSPEDQMFYYSAWFYGAIRVALSIPSLQTIPALSQRLKLSPHRVKRALNFLVSRDFVSREGDRYVATPLHMHLANDSAMIARHHANWRVRAMGSLDEESPKDLHYSYVATLAQEDVIHIKSLIVKYIEDVQKKIAPSKEETIYSFCVDFFEL